MAKKVIKKMQDGGPVPIPTKKTNPFKEALGERGKGTMDGPGKGIKPPSKSKSKLNSGPTTPKEPKDYEKYLGPVKDNGKLYYKKGGSVKKK